MHHTLCNNTGVGFVLFFHNYYLISTLIVSLNDETASTGSRQALQTKFLPQRGWVLMGAGRRTRYRRGRRHCASAGGGWGSRGGSLTRPVGSGRGRGCPPSRHLGSHGTAPRIRAQALQSSRREKTESPSPQMGYQEVGCCCNKYLKTVDVTLELGDG